MIQGARIADSGFWFFHPLYIRCKQEDVIGNRLIGSRIKCENTSVNWSKYSKPWDVIFDFPKNGIAQFIVGALPKVLPIEITGGGVPKPHSFIAAHVPLPENYPHCEIWTYKDGAHVSNPDLPKTVKKEFRQIVSDRSEILLNPEI